MVYYMNGKLSWRYISSKVSLFFRMLNYRFNIQQLTLVHNEEKVVTYIQYIMNHNISVMKCY